MCNEEAIKKLIAESEAKYERRLKEMTDKHELSHVAIAKTVSDFGSDVKKMKETVEEMHSTFQSVDWKKLKEIIISVQGITVVKNMFNGTAGFIISIGSIGVALSWLVRNVLK